MPRIISLLLCLLALPPVASCGSAAYTAADGDDHAFTDIIAIATGNNHSLAVKSDGTVWAWGSNEYGQLGQDPDAVPRSNLPTAIGAITNAVMVAAGGAHSLAVTADGMVWSWGRNNYGQLGDGGTDNRHAPAPINDIACAEFAAIAAGLGHSLALCADGIMVAWGRNNYGQLGNDELADSAVPVVVNLADSVTSIAAGSEHSLALGHDGTVWSWGRNSQAQLGYGEADWNVHRVPQQIDGFSGVVAVAAGWGHSAAVMADGTVWGWGDNDEGQLGDDTTENRYSPVPATGISSAAGIAGGFFHTVSLMGDGTLMSWGRNSEGQLGSGGADIYRDTPGYVISVAGARDVACSLRHCLALTTDGDIWAWGSNEDGELGFGLTGGFYEPERVQQP